MHRTSKSARRLSRRRLPAGRRTVGVDLEHEVRMVGAHGAHRLELPARLDLEPHPCRAGCTAASTSARNADRSWPGGMPTTAPTAIDPKPCSIPRASARERPSARSSASVTAISKAAASMRSPASPRTAAAPRHRGAAGRLAPAGLAQARHAPLGRGPFHLVDRRIDRGAAGERGALAPPLALFRDHVHEEQRAQGVHARSGGNVVAEGDVDPDQLDAAELQRTGAPTPATVDRSLYAVAFSPGWRNGRRGGLKSRCPKGRAGSSPARARSLVS